MKTGFKILISVIITLIVLWGTIFFIDYSRCSHLKEPIFVIAGTTADDGGTGTYYGLGYKVKITYNGVIMESYPAQIIATKIELAK